MATPLACVKNNVERQIATSLMPYEQHPHSPALGADLDQGAQLRGIARHSERQVGPADTRARCKAARAVARIVNIGYSWRSPLQANQEGTPGCSDARSDIAFCADPCGSRIQGCESPQFSGRPDGSCQDRCNGLAGGFLPMVWLSVIRRYVSDGLKQSDSGEPVHPLQCGEFVGFTGFPRRSASCARP